MGKYKIVNMKKAPSKEEIESLKSFDTILKSYRSQKRISRLKLIFILSTTLVAISTVLWNYFEINPESEAKLIESSGVVQLRQEPIVQDTLITDTVDTTEIHPNHLKEESKEFNNPVNSATPKNDTMVSKPDLQEYIFEEAYAPYDSDSLLGQFATQLNQIVKTSFQGNAIIAFKVSKDGSITEVKAIQPTTTEIDTLLIELWSNAPNWHPAEMNEKPVSSTITLPIEVNIQPVN